MRRKVRDFLADYTIIDPVTGCICICACALSACAFGTLAAQTELSGSTSAFRVVSVTECPQTQPLIDANAQSIAVMDTTRTNLGSEWGADMERRLTYLHDNRKNLQIACLLEADNGMVRTATSELENVTDRINAYAACRRSRRWWQVWKRRCGRGKP